MTLQEIISLANAGFNAKQIATLASMSVETPAPAPAPAPTPAPAPAPAQDPAHAPAPAPAQVQLPASATLPTNTDQMQAMFNSLIRSASIAYSEQPARETADDVLASIINPPTMKEENNGR